MHTVQGYSRQLLNNLLPSLCSMLVLAAQAEVLVEVALGQDQVVPV
jgi:hypothetical protein